MKTGPLIIAGGILFALGVAAGTILLPARPAPLVAPSDESAAADAMDAARRRAMMLAEANPGGSTLSGDFNTRLEDALHGPSQHARRHALATLADGLNSAQIQAALQQALKLGSREKQGVLAELMGRWAEIDPAGAAAYAIALTKRSDRASALSAVAGGWAESDPKAVEAWVNSLKDTKLRAFQ
jgi:hypothetical protein